MGFASVASAAGRAVRISSWTTPINVFRGMGIRCMSTTTASQSGGLDRIRNIGISAHIDSGKTTLTERVLFYTGRIKAIHEVRGKDDVGAKMDSMELEREKGITIASAATYTTWGDRSINIIDTPGHVDFTVEVERALRVLDGAVLVLCAVGGVQSQTLTVDRQMRRYNVPRIAFVNKCDRRGANPTKIIEQIRTKLRQNPSSMYLALLGQANAAAIQIPIGLEDDLEGVVDIIDRQAIYFEGPNGEQVVRKEVPANLVEEMEAARMTMIETLADVDEEIGDLFLMEETPSVEQLKAAIRRQTIGLKFVPVAVGSALKNTGVQPMLDAVCNYLPSPGEVPTIALDADNDLAPVRLSPGDPDAPFVGLVTHVGPGEICAIFGLECESGDTFTDGRQQFVMENMFVPEPVMSLSLKPKNNADMDALGKALNRFTKADPTFRIHIDDETGETIVSGMGELHLEVYKERLIREFNVETITGMPKVSYRETITQPAKYDYTHKKQSGGSGQYGRVSGTVEPIVASEDNSGDEEIDLNANVFVDNTVGNNIAKNYVPAIQKGFEEACEVGPLTGHPVQGVRFELKDGNQHAVDSSEMAFRAAGVGAMKQAVNLANPQVLEPIMKVEISVPEEFQGTVIGGINKKSGTVLDSATQEGYCTVVAEVSLAEMFGYSSELRSATQGKGEFSMEFCKYAPVNMGKQAELMKAYQEELKQKRK